MARAAWQAGKTATCTERRRGFNPLTVRMSDRDSQSEMQKSGWPLSWQRRGGKREYFYRGFRLEMIYLSSAHDMMWHWGVWRGERAIDCSRLASRREAIAFIDTLLKTPDHYECPRCDQVVLVNGTYGIEHRHQCIDLIANNTNQSVEKVASWRTNDHREGA